MSRQARSINDIILSFKNVHGYKYDYSKVEYKGSKEKVCIICPKHGEFWQSISNHENGSGCQICKNQLLKSINIGSDQNFIEKAKDVHRDKYDYSKVKYIGSKEKVCIICPEHGEFLQSPSKHLMQGCRECGITTKNKSRRNVSIQNINNKLNGEYSFNADNYVNCKQKIEILCNKCNNTFITTMDKLLNGGACTLCSPKSKGEQKIKEQLIKLDIKFILEKSFDTCKNPITNHKLRFDFWLPDHNLLIEFDGKQHFEPVSKWGGETELKKRQQLDKIKNIWAADNKIKLLRIPYFDKNIIDNLIDYI